MPPVHGQVSSKLIRASKTLGAVWPRADVRLLSSVGTHVGLEVVRTREFPLTDLALEGADAGVLSAVPAELVGARETLSAALVLADVWLLAGVLPDVHLEVGELEVALGATGVEADKGFPLLVGLCGSDWGLRLRVVRADVGSDGARREHEAWLSGGGYTEIKLTGDCSGCRLLRHARTGSG